MRVHRDSRVQKDCPGKAADIGRTEYVSSGPRSLAIMLFYYGIKRVITLFVNRNLSGFVSTSLGRHMVQYKLRCRIAQCSHNRSHSASSRHPSTENSSDLRLRFVELLV